MKVYCDCTRTRDDGGMQRGTGIVTGRRVVRVDGATCSHRETLSTAVDEDARIYPRCEGFCVGMI